MLRFCCLIHGSTMYRRKAALQVDGYDERLGVGQDYDFWLRLSEISNMASLSDVLYQYRQHDRMVSAQREDEQSDNARRARVRAIERRLTLGWKRVPLRQGTAHFRAFDRRELARRYVCWSAGARETGQRTALQFLLIALLLDPTTPDVWSYLVGILARKAGLMGWTSEGGCGLA